MWVEGWDRTISNSWMESSLLGMLALECNLSECGHIKSVRFWNLFRMYWITALSLAFQPQAECTGRGGWSEQSQVGCSCGYKVYWLIENWDKKEQRILKEYLFLLDVQDELKETIDNILEIKNGSYLRHKGIIGWERWNGDNDEEVCAMNADTWVIRRNGNTGWDSRWEVRR